jgi:hypothetical protein
MLISKKLLPIIIASIISFSALIISVAFAASTGEANLCPDGRPVCEDCINRGGDGCGGTNVENRSSGKDVGDSTTESSSSDTSTKQI